MPPSAEGGEDPPWRRELHARVHDGAIVEDEHVARLPREGDLVGTHVARHIVQCVEVLFIERRAIGKLHGGGGVVAFGARLARCGCGVTRG